MKLMQHEPDDYYEYALGSKFPIRKLIGFYWIWDKEGKRLVLYNRQDETYFAIPRIQMFSLFRFLVRVSQLKQK
jgi:hypothetical protein